MNKYQIGWKQLQNKKITITPLSFKFVKTLKEWEKNQKEMQDYKTILKKITTIISD